MYRFELYISTHLCHVGDAIAGPGEDGCLDASFPQGSVGADPVKEAVGAFTGFTEDDPS